MRLRGLDRVVIGWRQAIRHVGHTEVGDVRELHGPTRTIASTGGNWSERDAWEGGVAPTSDRVRVVPHTDGELEPAEPSGCEVAPPIATYSRWRGHDHDEMLGHLRDEWGTLGVLLKLLEPLSPPAQDQVLMAASERLRRGR